MVVYLHHGLRYSNYHGGVSGTASAGSGASHSIASKSLYHARQQQGVLFDKTILRVSFDDCFVYEKEVLLTEKKIILEGKEFRTTLTVLPNAKNDSTLLGLDFLQKVAVI